MCAGSLYSYIQDYNRRDSFSLKKKKTKQTNKQTNKRQQQKNIYIYSGPFTLPSRLQMTSRSCFLTGR